MILICCDGGMIKTDGERYNDVRLVQSPTCFAREPHQ